MGLIFYRDPALFMAWICQYTLPLCSCRAARQNWNTVETAMTTDKKLYRLRFVNEGKVFEVYTTRVDASRLPGFIEIGAVTFGEKSKLIVDPSEQELKSVFTGVSCSHIPMHAVIRVDEVDQQGSGRISSFEAGSNIAHFPAGIYPPGGKGGKDT
jgi:hypothetical protein